MLYTSVIVALAASLAAAADPAEIVNDNKPGLAWEAKLLKSDKSPITGSVQGQSSANGTGVEFTVNFKNLPATDGPYYYHIHEKPVPSDGNCTGAGPHLDPKNRGETPACNPATPWDCQVGDLSGKHGMIPAGIDPFSANYLDLYVSSTKGAEAYFGNRSIVVHNGQKQRIACGNFTKLFDDSGAATSASGSAAGATSTGAASSTGAATSSGAKTTVAASTTAAASKTSGAAAGATSSLISSNDAGKGAPITGSLVSAAVIALGFSIFL